MSLTAQDRQWFARRGELSHPEQQLVEMLLADIVYRAQAVPTMAIALDDRLAALEAAAVRYVIESRIDPDDPGQLTC